MRERERETGANFFTRHQQKKHGLLGLEFTLPKKPCKGRFRVACFQFFQCRFLAACGTKEKKETEDNTVTKGKEFFVVEASRRQSLWALGSVQERNVPILRITGKLSKKRGEPERKTQKQEFLGGGGGSGGT